MSILEPKKLTVAAASAAIDSQLDSVGIKGLDDGSGATGFYKNATDKVAYTIGNAPGSAGFPGTGAPAKALGALAIYQKFGDSTGGTNAPVTNTTQAAYLIANYYGPTADDSAEAFSTFVGIKATGTSYTQAKPVTAMECIAQVESGNTVDVNGYALGVGSRVNVLGTGHIDHAYGFKASVNTSGGPAFGTIGTYYGFCQPVTSGATNSYGVYVADKINSETAVSIGKSAYSGSFSAKLTGNGDSSNSMLLINLPTAADATGTLTGIRIVAPTGQTKPLQEWFGAGSGTAGSRIDSGGNFSARTSINLTDSTFSSNLMRLDSTGLTLTTGMNLILSTGSGTKIGTNVSQKLGFWNATPVIQQARPTDTASIITLLTTLGLCA